MGEIASPSDASHRRASGFSSSKRLSKQGLKCVALIVGDGDEAPRRELAMIGRSRGDRQDARQLLGRRTGPDQLARLARAAGLEQRQDRCSGR